LVIVDNYDLISAWTANYIKDAIVNFHPTGEKPFVLGLPTGSTPIGTYKKLIEYHKKGELSFENVVTFNMDEYVGLPEDHDQSYHYFMWNTFFKHINIKASNVHILNGNATNLKEECDLYEKTISQAGKIHLFLGGIGTDGHIAFNEPGSSLTSRTRPVILSQDTLVSNARFFGSDPNKVPKNALTVGIQTIMDAHEVVIGISGPNKAFALEQLVEGSVSHMCPASILQMHPKAVIVCDEDSIGELRVKTVKYFKNLESSKKIH